MIITKNLQKSFHGNQILKGIDIHIEQGEKVVRENLRFCVA